MARKEIADTAPEIMIARLSGETATIRLGSGGIMLPHYSSFKVAETFRMLEALAPGRVDLGVGRAPAERGWFQRRCAAAIRSASPSRSSRRWRTRRHRRRSALQRPRRATGGRVRAGAVDPRLVGFRRPAGGATRLTLCVRAIHRRPVPAGDAHLSRHVQPSPWSAAPRVIVTFAALVAPTDEEADALALPALLSRLRRLRGLSAPLPSLAEAQAYPWTPGERAEVAASRNIITGSPATVCARLATLAAEYHADELMIVTIAPDYATRMRSYELLADGWRAANTSGNAAVTSMSAAPA